MFWTSSLSSNWLIRLKSFLPFSLFIFILLDDIQVNETEISSIDNSEIFSLILIILFGSQ